MLFCVFARREPERSMFRKIENVRVSMCEQLVLSSWYGFIVVRVPDMNSDPRIDLVSVCIGLVLQPVVCPTRDTYEAL